MSDLDRSAKFDKSQLRGFDDGRFLGGFPPGNLFDWFPTDLAVKYGEVQLTPNGEHLVIYANRKDALFAELVSRGYVVRESQNLRVFMHYAYGSALDD